MAHALALTLPHGSCFAVTMSDEISTYYVKRSFAVADDVVLARTRTTRTVFHPAMHSGGVRSSIVR